MWQLMGKLWSDELGVVVSTELVLIESIAVLGLLVGLNEVKIAVNNELNDVSNAIGALNQGFIYKGQQSVAVDGTLKSGISGTGFTDNQDICDVGSLLVVEQGYGGNEGVATSTF